jgi:UDP-N-acetylmuramate dehydrogenase
MLEGLKENVSLKDYSTMRLGGNARYLCEIEDYRDIPTIIDWADQNKLPVVMIGTGSNIIWGDEGYPGIVIVNKIPGYEVQDQGEQQFIIVGAGEEWDSVVERTVQAQLSGLEFLSLIPGTAGATPIQNVGAYGKEIADTLVCVQAYDRVDKKMVVIPKSECDFGYRTSRFKTKDKGRFFITSLTFSLSKRLPLPPFYPAITNYLENNKISIMGITTKILRDVVIAVRSEKLPDPKIVANCGSFFHNPVITMMELEEIRGDYPGIVYWPVGDDMAKVSAAWLLEQLGLKGYHEPNTGIAVWEKQALVFVNEKATSTAQLLAFRDAVIKSVQEKFGITLEQEPELLN